MFFLTRAGIRHLDEGLKEFQGVGFVAKSILLFMGIGGILAVLPLDFILLPIWVLAGLFNSGKDENKGNN